MAGQYAYYPFTASGGVAVYPNFASFPTSAPAGTLAVAQDTGIVYEYFNGAWTAVAGPNDALTLGTPANGLAISNNQLTLTAASASQNGALLSTDWTTFNNKQAAGNYITALTGDVTASGPGSSVASLVATTNATLTTLSALSLPFTQTTGNVLLTRLSPVPTGSIIGNNTGSTVAPAALTVTTVTSMLNVFTSTLKGLTPLSGGGTTNFLRADGTWAVPASSGTVTSVALADDTGLFTISGSPVTTSGTLTLASLSSQAANTFLAAPNGSAGSPTFRTIVVADVPTLNQNTTGTASNITATSNSTLTTLSSLALPLTQTTGTLPINRGGTGVTAVPTTPTASAFAAWDANKNMSGNNILDGFTTIATAAATTTLTVASTGQYVFTGTTTQTVVLPVASTLVNGFTFSITNRSTGLVTVTTSGSTTVQSMASNTVLNIVCINAAGGTGTASWSWTYLPGQSMANAFKALTIQTFGAPGTFTYTTPTNPAPLYLEVVMVGAGGGGDGTAGGAGGGTGGATSFTGSGVTLTANGGARVVGGTATVTGAIGVAVAGGTGEPPAGPVNSAGGNGSGGFFGGNGGGTQAGVAGGNATAAGGGGGGAGGAVSAAGGFGGGAGAYIDATFSSLASTYSVTVGTGGTAGPAPGGGTAGGVGGNGLVIVYEYYQ